MKCWADESWARNQEIAGRNINNLRYADDTTLMAESEEELKSLLMRVREESNNAGLKFNIQKMKVRASSPINSWQIDGEQLETVADFIFLDSKITADGDCSHEIKRRLLLGRKAMTNLDSILKSRDITLPTKFCLVKAMVQWMWELDYKEGWALKNWYFQTVVLKKTLERVPWTTRSNQSVLMEINLKYSLEGLMLKLQYFGHLIWEPTHWERPWCWEIEGRRRRGQQRMSWLDGITNSMDMALSNSRR